MEQLIRAANFTRYYSRDVDKLSQLPRNCRVRATYHPSNLAQREIAASCAARVPPRRTLLFLALFSMYVYIYVSRRCVTTPLPPPSGKTLASSTTRRVSCIALGNLSAIGRTPTNRSTNFLSPPHLPRLTLTKRRLPSIKSTREHRRYSYRVKSDERNENCLYNSIHGDAANESCLCIQPDGKFKLLFRNTI